MPRKKQKNASSKMAKEQSEHGSDDDGGNEESAMNMWSCEEKFARDSFYQKLIMLNVSSGLSLVFNFWETKLDLYLVYKEVIERGGAYEVSRAGKWDEVASAVSFKTRIPILPSQVQNIYEILIFMYEQIHHYRTPGDVFGKRKSYYSSSEDYQEEQGSFGRGSMVLEEVPSCIDLRCQEEYEEAPTYRSSGGKRKSHGSLSEDDHAKKAKGKKSNLVSQEDQAEKGKLRAPNIQVPRGPGRPKTVIREPGAPLAAKTGYQMFLKIECERLKKIHGETSSKGNIRDMATEAWRQLPNDERLTYIQAGRKDKERFDTEMAIYMKRNQNTKPEDIPTGSTSTSTVINLGTSQAVHDGCYVPQQGNAGNFPVAVEEPSREVFVEVKPYHPVFQMNWDGSCDSPATSS